MSLLDAVSEAKYNPDSGAHPSEGCLHNGVFIRVEDGGESSYTYQLNKYTGVTTRMLNSGEKLVNQETIIDCEWDGCLQIYDLQVEIFQGLREQSEVDEEVEKILSGQAQQAQMNQNPAQQGPQQPAQPGQQQQAPPAPTKGTQQDMLKMLANVDGALGKPVYEIVQEIETMQRDGNIELDMDDHQIYEVVNQWKVGDFSLDEEGNVTKGEVKVPEREEEEEEEEDEEEDDGSGQTFPVQTTEEEKVVDQFLGESDEPAEDAEEEV